MTSTALLSRRRAGCRWAAALSSFLLLGADCSSPPSNNAARLSPEDQGSIWYAAFCAECHGPIGAGDGPSGADLASAPPDLRRIALRQGGFDPDRVAAFVDGREDVALHGPREMPVWGRVRDDRLQVALEEDLRLTPQAIGEIVAFLRTQQIR